MATKTIGSAGRQYSTLQGWEDYIPATLTEDEIGECYNDSEFTGSTTLFSCDGHTGSFWIKLRCASGQGWRDQAGVRTTAKKYNQTNGVAISNTGAVSCFVVDQPRFEMNGLQIKCTVDSGRPIDAATGFGICTPSLFKDLMIQWQYNAGNGGFKIYGSAAQMVNCTIFVTQGYGDGVQIGAGAQAIACDVIRAVAPSEGTAFTNQGSNNVMVSCNAFGFTNAAAGSNWDTTASKYNATDKSSGLPGTNNVHSVTFSNTTPWTQRSTTSTDLRPIASTSLDNAGFLDSTNAPNDCTGTARDSSPTIGSWELVSGGGPPPAGMAGFRSLLGVGR